MELYWAIFILIAVFALAEQNFLISKKTTIRLFHIFIIVLFCLSFMRWERGTDWIGYYNAFLVSDSPDWNSHMELGYTLLNRVIRKFTDNYTIYLFVQSGLYYSLYVLYVYKINRLLKTSDNCYCCYFPLLLYGFSQGFAGMFNVRSGIAYLICSIAIFEIYNNNKYRFVLYVVTASFFHYSSLLFLIAYPLFWMKFTKFRTMLFIILVFVFFQMGSYYAGVLNFFKFEEYTIYIKENTQQSVLGVLKYMTLLFLVFMIRPRRDMTLYRGVAKITFVGILFYIWCQFFSPVAQRLAGLFMGNLVVWGAMFFYNYRKKSRITFLIGQIVFCAVSLWSLLNSAYKDLFVPYKFFWDTFQVEVF